MKELDFIKEYQSKFSGAVDKSKKMDIYPSPTSPHPFIIERGDIKIGCVYLHYDREFYSPVVWIMYLRSYTQSSGNGSRILRGLCELADLRGVTLYLEPGPDKLSSLNFPALVSWYRRYGFTGDNTMERKPSA